VGALVALMDGAGAVWAVEADGAARASSNVPALTSRATAEADERVVFMREVWSCN